MYIFFLLIEYTMNKDKIYQTTIYVIMIVTRMDGRENERPSELHLHLIFIAILTLWN